jgi:hypothetical protein
MNIKKILSPSPEVRVSDDAELEEIKCIGLVLNYDPDATSTCFENVEYIIRNGKVIKKTVLSKSYDPSEAINEATAWIDKHYWAADKVDNV